MVPRKSNNTIPDFAMKQKVQKFGHFEETHSSKNFNRWCSWKHFRQVLKLFVCVCCVGGFILQTTEFIEIYFGYPIVLDAQLKNPLKIPMPAFTLCSNNHVRRNVFCSKYPEDCIRAEHWESLCGNLPHICENDLIYPNDTKLFERVFDRPISLWKSLAPQENSLVGLCRIADFNTHHNCSLGITYMGTRDVMYIYHNCFRVTFVEGEGLVPAYSKNSDLYFSVGFEQAEYASPRIPVYLQMSVHEPFSFVSPFVDGFEIKPGKQYEISLKIEEKHLLSSPYETNCTDYISRWEDRGRKGHNTQYTCVEECKKNASIARCNCTDLRVKIIFEDDVQCKRGLEYCITEEDLNNCVLKCTQACDHFKFLVDLSETDLYHDPSDVLYGQKPTTSSLLRISNNKVEITKYSYRAQYQSVEILSYIGGYIGIWLGISLVAVFNFLEAAVIALPAVFRKKSGNKKKLFKKVLVNQKEKIVRLR